MNDMTDLTNTTDTTDTAEAGSIASDTQSTWLQPWSLSVGGMTLAQPLFLMLLLLVAPMLWAYLRQQRRRTIRFSSLELLSQISGSRFIWMRHVPFILRCMVVTCLAVALARPQSAPAGGKRTSEGLDIVLIIDTSRSMEARDFVLGGERPTRLDVVKKVIADFIKDRPGDRVGMVVFGSEAFTQAPLTLDHNVLLRFMERIQIGLAGDATAIGDGLATAVNRLKDIEAKTRIAILLTDGGNTAGRVDPLAAAQAAKAKSVRVYTIGVGSKSRVPVDVGGRMQTQKVDIDTELLEAIAKETGGQSFLATDTETLVNVYNTIDRLEKTKVKIDTFDNREERYASLVWSALALLCAELILALTRFRSVP